MNASPVLPAEEAALPEIAEDAIALTMGSPMMHFACFERIEDKSGDMARPMPTEFQMAIGQAVEWCIANGVPIRIVGGPKARQSGGSTICGGIAYHLSRSWRCNSLLMADEDDRTDKLWAMLLRFAENDEFAAYWGTEWQSTDKSARAVWNDERGVMREAVWERETANDPKAGAAGTRRILWFSEAARYKKTGAAQDTLVIGNALNSLPADPLTAVFLESTAEGAIGYFVDTHGGAVTLKERMAGKVGNGWIKIFCGWHECADYSLPRSAMNEAWFDDADPQFARFKPREEAGRIRWQWTPEQIAWRRQKIISDLKGDERLFDRDYPDSEETAFAASTSAALDPVGLAAIDAESKPVEPERGQITQHSARGLVFMPTTDDQATHHFWEHPFEGARYIVTVDTKSDVADKQTGETDANVALVIRDAVVDAHGTAHPAKVVARVAPENRMEPKPFAHLTALLAHYFAAPIIVEANAGGAVIRELRDEHHCDIIKRPVFDNATQRSTERLGWWTDETSRRVMISDLQSYVREQKIVVLCRHIFSELSTLGVNAKGKVLAMGRAHDDDCTALAMGLTCLPMARRYARAKAKKPEAPDARRWKSVGMWS